MRRISKTVVVFYSVIFLFFVYMVAMYVFIGAEHTPMVKAKMKHSEFHLDTWKLFFYPHIILGMIALAIGPFQFTKSSHKKTAIHKSLGKIYAVSILLNVLAVPYIALFSTGGISSEIAFLILDLFWLVTTLMGVIRIYQHNINAHKIWMLRSYAITWVFVSFRVFVAIFSLFMDANLAFPASVGIAIVINLLFIEMMQKRKQYRKSRTSNITV